MAFKKLKYWFDKDLAILLADKIVRERPRFDKKRFVETIDQGTADLELKDRVELICDQLHAQLGARYARDIKVLMKILGPENPNTTGMFTEYYWVMPVAKYVEKYGLDHFELSMKAIAEVTKRNTSEYAIRPYLQDHTLATLKQMKAWSKSDNFHVRRLASEGVRPRLPWAAKLDIFIEQPKKIVPILNNLKDDKVKFVQKSVANCLNDIYKDNLDIGKQVVEKWNTASASKERKWIIKHSLRKLKKEGDPWALDILASL